MSDSLASALGEWKETPAPYRLAPFFVLNEDLGTDLSRMRARQILEQFKEIGYGGVFLHPRVGLITEYKSEEWFDFIAHCIIECKRLGLDAHLYDENSYPSGSAGGHVLADHPEARARFVSFQITHAPPAHQEHFTACIEAQEVFLAAYELDERGLQPVRKLDDDEFKFWIKDRHPAALVEADVRPIKPVLLFYLKDMRSTPWHGEFPYVSLVDPVVARSFIKHTHAEYATRFGHEFGQSVSSIFTDEPNLFTCGSGPMHCAVHLTPYIFSQFQDRYGYDLRDHLAELFFDFGDFSHVRFDYYDLLHLLWVENWAKPLKTWCEEHCIDLTGHYLEHDWPVPYVTPGHVHLLAYLDCPGIDLLYANALLGEDAPWFTLQKKSEPGIEPLLTLLIIQCASVARQLGKKRVMCEAWGAGGHDSTPADYRRIGEWLIANGINFLVPHHSMLTIRGSRKADHPQFFSDQASWFLHTRSLNDHLARLCFWMSQGKQKSEIVIIDPLTTGYIKATRSRPNQDTFSDLCNGFSNFIQTLTDQHFAFDIGDEYIIEEFGLAKAGVFVIGEQAYKVVILPAGTENLRSATVERMEIFADSGGILIFGGANFDQIKVDGKNDGRLGRLARKCPQNVLVIPEEWELVAYLSDRHPSPIQIERHKEIRGIYHQRRILDDGAEIHLLVNSGDKAFEGKITILGESIVRLDTIKGEESPLPYVKTSDGEIQFSHKFEAQDSLLLLLAHSKNEFSQEWQGVPNLSTFQNGSTEWQGDLRILDVRPMSKNRMVLDFCDLHMEGEAEQTGLAVWHAQDVLFKRHGFIRNPWHRAIQYKRQILDRNDLLQTRGFFAEYSFVWTGSSKPEQLQIAVECPEYFQITLNGETLESHHFHPCELDPWILAAEASEFVQQGTNRIRIHAMSFDVRMEIEPIFLLGDFSVWPKSDGFELHEAAALGVGSWKAQGMPFYDRSVDYSYQLPDISSEDHGAWMEFMIPADFSLIEVWRGGQKIAEFGWSPGPLRIPISELYRASGDLIFRVIGSPHNLFGAFHDPKRPKRICGNIFAGPRTGPVSGTKYDTRDYGIFGAVRWKMAGAAKPLEACVSEPSTFRPIDAQSLVGQRSDI